jgi:hypothetical protein
MGDVVYVLDDELQTKNKKSTNNALAAFLFSVRNMS